MDASCPSNDPAQWLAAIVDSCADAIISVDINGIIRYWNHAAEHIYGYKPDEAIGRSVNMLIPADRLCEEAAILQSIRSGRRVEPFSTMRLRKDGTAIDIQLTVSPVRNAAGDVIGASKIARDITAEKRNEELITTLKREAEHRTKNILASATAIVRLSNANSSEELKQTIEKRLEALARVHERLSDAGWSGTDVRHLVETAIGPYSPRGDARATLSGPQINVSPEVAQVLAVTFHELATNAAKYGAWSGDIGSVEIAWEPTPLELGITWREIGGPPTQEPSRRGFGTKATQRLVEGYLRGSLTFDWQAEGLTCRISISL